MTSVSAESNGPKPHPEQRLLQQRLEGWRRALRAVSSWFETRAKRRSSPCGIMIAVE
jgi:hypothetical protein